MGSSEPSEHEATRILNALAERSGEGSAQRDRLLELVYDALRRVAATFLADERPDHTLQPTALVHEAYLKLVGQESVSWEGRSHFMALAAQAMRRILVDHARGRGREKRGGDWQRIELEPEFAPGAEEPRDLLALDGALQRLAEVSERQARVVELRFFGGLSTEVTAQVLGVSERTVVREWRFAKAWLTASLGESTA